MQAISLPDVQCRTSKEYSGENRWNEASSLLGRQRLLLQDIACVAFFLLIGGGEKKRAPFFCVGISGWRRVGRRPALTP
jgi:hypothetical protein